MVAARWLFLLRRFFKKMILPRLIIVWINGPLLAGTEEQENVHFTLFERTDSFIGVWSERGNLIAGGCIVSLSPVIFLIFLFFLKKREKIRLFITLISFHVWRPLFHFFKKKFTMKSERCNYFRLQPRCIADNICCRDDVDASAHYFLVTQAALQSFPGILCRLWSVWTTHVTLQADHLSFSFWPVS